MPGDVITDPYSGAASGFDDSFGTNLCRKAYDILGWQAVAAIPLPPDAVVVDAGCGTGRWVERFLARGHRVVGIERAPGMVAQLEGKHLGDRFTLLPTAMEDAVLPDASADLVIAIGSLQYTPDRDAVLRAFGRWLKPGGRVALMVDSLMALVQERVQEGRAAEALEILRTRQGSYHFGESEMTLELFSREELTRRLEAAGFAVDSVRGLVVSAAALGRSGCEAAMRADEAGFLRTDAALAQHPVTADGGLHLLAIATRL
jgi:SAM-dependent methyltransferase